MLLLLVIGMSALVEILGASPAVDSQPRPQVIRYDLDTDNMPNSYKYHYDASDGSSRTEHGAMVDSGKGEMALDVLGAVRWYDEKGHLFEMTYKAGKRGYRTIIKMLS
ncbi:larval cuticle protein 65Ab1-like [Pararge aegeria]|uniref:Jg9505 protein n=2 Tax=Pararge aegeria TaxID=116150 RepID=A0A8S4RH29_9NEOP|nr:larval cuticle protein 65Ab1-like [Pararge aegeria]CAH2237013.1 jg9505 [Pararge aegeria aegeria]